MPSNDALPMIFDRLRPDRPAVIHGMPTLADEALAAIRERMDKLPHGTCTGMADLDGCLEKLRPGALYVLAAHPGVPRTAYALHLVRGVATYPETAQRVLYVSLDADRVELVKMLAASVGNLDFRGLDQGTLPEAELPKLDAAMQQIRGWPLDFFDPLALDVDQLPAVVKQRMEPWDGLALVVVDDIRELLTAGQSTDRHAAREALRRIKIMAADLGLPVLVVCDLPDLGQVDPESYKAAAIVLAEIGQAADGVLSLRCTGRVDEGRSLAIQVQILRNRHGPTGDVLMRYSLAFRSYSPAEDAAG